MTPRSVTTTLQPLLALGRERFRPLLLDEMTRGAVGRAAFGTLDDRYFVRLDLPEQAEVIYVHTLVTEATSLSFPNVDRLPEARFNDALPERYRTEVMPFDEVTLRRLVLADVMRTHGSSASQTTPRAAVA
ncbi:MAG: hypothetical protein AAFX81_08765 [Pseudomonadota bacterium]